MNPQERLFHDVESGINQHAVYLLRYGGEAAAKTIVEQRSGLRDAVINELRIRWTLVERPRKQTTLRQES
jgi:hypothetical protein